MAYARVAKWAKRSPIVSRDSSIKSETLYGFETKESREEHLTPH